MIVVVLPPRSGKVYSAQILAEAALLADDFDRMAEDADADYCGDAPTLDQAVPHICGAFMPMDIPTQPQARIPWYTTGFL